MRELFLLGALDRDGGLTPLGAAMSRLPIEPRLSRTLLRAAKLRCLETTASVCAMVCGDDPFIRAGGAEAQQAAQETRAALDCGEGGLIVRLRLFEEWQAAPAARRVGWCAARGVHPRAMRAAGEVRAQLLQAMRSGGAAGGAAAAPRDGTASAETRRRCRQALCRGYFMNAAKRARGLCVYTTLAPPQHTVVPRGGATAEALAGVEYLVFTELVWVGKATMTHTCLVEHAWLEPLLPLVERVRPEPDPDPEP